MIDLELLHPAAEEQLRVALADPELERYQKAFTAETLAALAVVGRHPEGLRDLVAAITPPAARVQLDALQLIDRIDTGDRVTWRLTDVGHRIASALAAAAPPVTDEQRRQADEELRRLIEEGNADLEDGS